MKDTFVYLHPSGNIDISWIRFESDSYLLCEMGYFQEDGKIKSRGYDWSEPITESESNMTVSELMKSRGYIRLTDGEEYNRCLSNFGFYDEPSPQEINDYWEYREECETVEREMFG